jgi:hypothetical protein
MPLFAGINDLTMFNRIVTLGCPVCGLLAPLWVLVLLSVSAWWHERRAAKPKSSGQEQRRHPPE